MEYIELLIPELDKMELDDFAIEDATDPHSSATLQQDAIKYLASQLRREDSRFAHASKERRQEIIELYLEEYY